MQLRWKELSSSEIRVQTQILNVLPTIHSDGVSDFMMKKIIWTSCLLISLNFNSIISVRLNAEYLLNNIYCNS